MTKHFIPCPKAPKFPRDRVYLGYVKQLPCCICQTFGAPFGQPPSDAHHVICGRFSQAKTPDCMAIPLCKGHHQTGENGKIAIHRNKAAWVKAYGADTDNILPTQDAVARIFGYTRKGTIS